MTDVVEQIVRFCLFQAFFKMKKATPQIPETKQHYSFTLDDCNHGVLVSAFLSLLQTLSVTPDLPENGKPWTCHLVQLADMLLNHNCNVTNVTPLTTQQ
jgi:DNA polymerase phi